MKRSQDNAAIYTAPLQFLPLFSRHLLCSEAGALTLCQLLPEQVHVVVLLQSFRVSWEEISVLARGVRVGGTAGLEEQQMPLLFFPRDEAAIPEGWVSAGGLSTRSGVCAL